MQQVFKQRQFAARQIKRPGRADQLALRPVEPQASDRLILGLQTRAAAGKGADARGE